MRLLEAPGRITGCQTFAAGSRPGKDGIGTSRCRSQGLSGNDRLRIEQASRRNNWREGGNYFRLTVERGAAVRRTARIERARNEP
jgi:hypothetical protein